MAILEDAVLYPPSLKERAVATAAVFARTLRPHLQIVTTPLLEVARAASSVFLCGSWKTGALLCAALLFMPRYFAFAVSACLLGGFIEAYDTLQRVGMRHEEAAACLRAARNPARKKAVRSKDERGPFKGLRGSALRRCRRLSGRRRG
jgi:hypothetical protein